MIAPINKKYRPILQGSQIEYILSLISADIHSTENPFELSHKLELYQYLSDQLQKVGIPVSEKSPVNVNHTILATAAKLDNSKLTDTESQFLASFTKSQEN